MFSGLAYLQDALGLSASQRAQIFGDLYCYITQLALNSKRRQTLFEQLHTEVLGTSIDNVSYDTSSADDIIQQLQQCSA